MSNPRVLGPRPNPAFSKQIAVDVPSPFIQSVSGEITSSKSGIPLSCGSVDGKITNSFLSVLNCGKDTVNPLSIEADIKINGSTIFTTKPKITASSSTGTNKTTKNSGTNIVQGVLNTNVSYSAGDVLTWDIIIVRTASPTTEISNPFVVVELQPNK